MEPIPYQITGEDVDEVLGVYEAVGGSWTAEQRDAARDYVMSHVLDIDEAVRTAPEDRRVLPRGDGAVQDGNSPGDTSPARREMALAAIEDLLIRDGFIEASSDDDRVFPVGERRTQ